MTFCTITEPHLFTGPLRRVAGNVRRNIALLGIEQRPQGHRAEVDLRPGLGVQEVGRGSPTWALRPAPRQPMQLAERAGHATLVGRRLGRSAIQIGHHHQTVDEQSTVRRRDRHRHGQTFTVEVLEELGLPREISVAPGTETTDREVPAGPESGPRRVSQLAPDGDA
jgi:hypothetical protein